MFMQYITGFDAILSFNVIGLILFGTCVGIMFGASPGLTASMGMALLMPITFSMNTISSMALLIGLYIGGTSGGMITAVLLGIPGTPAAIATTFDGYPMARNGRPAAALGFGLISSFVGGMISLVILFNIAPRLAEVAVKFTPADYFAVTLFSLSLIAGLTGKSIIKGLMSGIIGLMVATIGPAALEVTPRFTFGFESFNAGFQLICVLVSVYAVAELFLFSGQSYKDDFDLSYDTSKLKGFGVKLKDFQGQVFNLVRSALMGTFIGILPGIGAGTSNIMAYSAAKNASKTPEEFGNGIKDGIIASETANNAVTGGAMVPLLTLGIPGDAGTAILLAGLTLQGIAPGPLIFTKSADIIYAIFATLIVANVLMILVEYWGMKTFLHLVKIPRHYILTIVMLFCVIGAYSQNNRIFDVYSVWMIGVLAFVLVKLGFDMTPFVMGFILGAILERNLLRGLMFEDGSFLHFFQRPISGTFLILTIGYILYVSITGFIAKNKKVSLDTVES